MCIYMLSCQYVSYIICCISVVYLVLCFCHFICFFVLVVVVYYCVYDHGRQLDGLLSHWQPAFVNKLID